MEAEKARRFFKDRLTIGQTRTFTWFLGEEEGPAPGVYKSYVKSRGVVVGVGTGTDAL